MRPGQQNKRGRGRNNGGNRKGGNPLSRTYDSSGPDVKIRGTAQHIAEKYATLARDAQGTGDNVMAENYLQHAEHYNRIILAAQAQIQERHQREDRDGVDRDGGDRDGGDHRDGADRGHGPRDEYEQRQPAMADAESSGGRSQDPQPDRPKAAAADNRSPAADALPINGAGPQPVIEGTPAEVAIEEDEAQPVKRVRKRSASTRPRRQPRSGNGQTDEAGDGAADKTKKSVRSSASVAASGDGAETAGSVVE